MNANKKLVIERWQDNAALSRFRMIAPLCDETIDHAKRVQLRIEAFVNEQKEASGNIEEVNPDIK